jgi:FtsP/CotA-like multicopper oxidase with cupredoxin domain
MKLALMSFTVLFVVLVSLIRFSSIEATVDEDGRTIRSYSFLARPSSLPLRDQLIYTTTQLYDEWPKRLNRLPRTINAAVAHSDNFNGTLMGQPIHCQVGDRLQINLTNDISYSGLSLHMHGFGYGGEFFYDGSVGVSQCPLGDAKSQMYDLVVEEAPGTYWYHTQSGHLGVNAVDMIRGPLIVHPNGTFPRVELSPLSYDNERILFFQDGSLLSSEARYARQIGNSNGPAVRNDEGFIVSSDPWDFGTCNGKLREVIHVKRNKKHKLRLINGGTHHALRIAIDNFFMTVVAVDSEPIEPFKADEVVLHVGERVDVIVDVYGDLFESETFWIRADSLGPSSRGFSNGIRAVLRISEEQGPVPNDKDIADPPQNIQTVRDEEKVIKTLNCHSQKYSECIPVTALRPLNVSKAEESRLNSEIHYVDLHSKSAPQYSHFVRVDNGGNFTQNELPLVALASRNFDRLTDWHPNTVMLELSRTSPNIIVWRNTMLTDIPFNIHGQKGMSDWLATTTLCSDK